MPRHVYIPLADRNNHSHTDITDDPHGETDDGFTPQQPELAPRSFLRGKSRRPLALGLIAVVALILVFSFSAPHTIAWPQWREGSNSTATPLRSCGGSPEAAIEAGCVFDLMAFAWAQPACFDEELTAEFLGLKEWTWWADVEGTAEVPREEVALGAYEELFVSWEQQLQQCVFLWKKMQRAVMAKTPLDSNTLDPDRTARCGDMLLDRQGPAGKITMFEAKYTTCGIDQ